MNGVLGNNYQIFAPGTMDPIVLAKLPDEDLAPKNSVTNGNSFAEGNSFSEGKGSVNPVSSLPKTTDDYVFQFYLGSMTVVGLFVLFRMIQKSK